MHIALFLSLYLCPKQGTDVRNIYNRKPEYFKSYWPLYIYIPRLVTGEKNSPTVAHACHKRRIKLVFGGWGYNWATQSPGDMNMEIWFSRLGLGVGLTTPHRKKSIVRKPKMWPRNSQIDWRRLGEVH
jgi:hypothetical protein